MYEVKGHWRTAAMAATVVLVASGVTGALPTALPGQFAPNAAAQTTGISPTEYLTNTWTSDPPTYEGNLSDSTNCIVKWQTQAVYSSQLGPLSGGLSPSIRGFLQDVMYGDYPTGKLQLQHFPSGKNVAWRLPIAVDQQIKGATLVIDFDDPDYDKTWADTMTAAKVSQNPGWWDAPGVNPAYPEGRTWFQRFTGISGYVPLSDKPLPVRVDAAARKIYVDLGDMPAKSSTVLSFSAVPANGLTAGATNNPLSYGLRATLDGSSINSCYNPSYASQNVVVGSSGNQFPAPTDPTRPLPAGTTFAIAPGYQPPAGWSIAVDPATGAMTVTPGPDAVPGQAVNVPVLVTYRDGTTDTAIAPLVVQDNEAGLNTPGYEAGNVKPGESLTLQQTADTDLPPGTRFSVPSDFTPPAGWTYSIDPATGAVNVQAPPGAQPGDRIDVPVTVTYPDGTTDNAMASIVVIPNDAQANSPAYDQATTKPGVAVDISQVGDTSMPDGTQYTLDGYTPPTGWSVTIDSQTGALTVTPPADANPGDSIAVPVVIKYPDGSTQTVTAPVVVTANDAQLNSPGYSPGETRPGQQITLPQDRDTEMPAGTTYAIRDGFVIPDGWTVSVDVSTGAVTATPPADANPGDVLSLPVVATYPDGSTDTALAAVTVIANQAQLNAPGYDATTTRPGTTLTLTQTRETTLPDGTTFAVDPAWSAPAGWTVTVAPNGDVTYVVPPDAQPGDSASVPVVVTYPDGSVDRTFATVSVIASDAMNHSPGYDPATTTPGVPVSVAQSRDPNMPADASFAIDPNWTPPAGWTVTLDTSPGAVPGTVIVTPPADAQPGQAISVPVVVTYGDGSVDNTFVGVTVTPNDTQAHSPGYLPGSTTAGVPVTIEQTLDGNMPAGTTYAIDPASIPAGWTATVDGNGAVTATPPAGANPGDSTTFTVNVRYPDGTTDAPTVTVLVNANASQQTDLHYDSQVTKPAEPVTVDAHIAPSTPPGTTFVIDPGYTPPAGWTATIDPATGAVTVTPPAGAQPNDTISVPVTATYADGSTDSATAIVVVIPSDAQITTVTYNPATTKPGVLVTLDPVLNSPLPAGTTVAVGDVPAGWTVTVDGNGVVSATPPADAQPGEIAVIPVVYTYPDGSTETAYAPVTVEAADSFTNAPGYEQASTSPGTAVTVPQTLDENLPPGTTFGPGSGGQIPAGWDVQIDPSGAVTVTPPKDAKAGDTALIPVLVTYPDGSTDTATVPVVVTEQPVAVHSPGYNSTTVAPGGTVTVDQTQDPGVPSGTTYAMDQSAIPAGWTVSIDSATGQITATSPATALAGEAISVPVTLTYPNGTTQTVYAAVTVKSVEERKYNPHYDAGSTPPGVETTVPLTGDTLPGGTSFTQDPRYVPPAGWAISVDPTTGAVSVTPPDTALAGDSVSVPVIVTYPDGSQEVIDAVVTVENTQARTFDPSYAHTEVQLGIPKTVSQSGDTLPDGTAYAIDPTWTVPAGWDVSIDPATGAVTATATDDTYAGTSIAVPVVITYPDRTVDRTTATFTLLTTDARAYAPGYEPATTQPGTPVPVPQTGDVPLPDGTRYRIADGYTPPAGWTATVDAATGVVTVTPPADAPNGAAITVPIVVSYPDQSLDDTQVSVTVTVLDNVAYTPNYNLVSTKPGTTVTSPQLASDLPSGTTFAITDGFQVPAGWTITVDEATGEVTFVVPPDAAPTTVVAVPITVRYPDGTTGAATAQVKVEQSNPGDTIVDRGTIEPGQTIVLDPQDPNLYPPGTVFRFPDGWTPPAGWEVSFDQDKRQLTITAPPTAQPGDVIAIPMYITAPDGREFNRTVLVTVVEPKPVTTDADRHNPAYPTATTKPGQQVTVEQNGDTLPAGTTCSIVYQPQGWEVTLGANCEVIATPPAGVALGTYAVQVRFTYPDGSEDTTFADITVADDTPAESDAQKYNPGYTEVTGAPGETVSVPQTGDTVPAGTTCTLGTPPAGWTVTIGADCTLQVTVPNDAADGTYDIPVQFTYPDGTSETVNAKVTVGEPSGGGSIGELDLGSLGGDGEGSLGGSTGGSSGEGGSGSLGSLGSLGSTGGSSTGSLLGLGSLALGGLAIGGLVWAVNNHLIMLPPGFVLPPFLAPFFPGLVEQPPLPPAPPAPGPDVDNGRG